MSTSDKNRLGARFVPARRVLETSLTCAPRERRGRSLAGPRLGLLGRTGVPLRRGGESYEEVGRLVAEGRAVLGTGDGVTAALLQANGSKVKTDSG